MILVDTGPLVAIFDQTDGEHPRSIEVLGRIEEPVATTVPVLTEAFHLLGPATASKLREFVMRGGLQILFHDDDLIVRAFELMAKYADTPMDFTDASLVAVAERFHLNKVFTIDRKEFTTYRIKRGHGHIPFKIVM